jgi:hypothetical protein
MKCDFPHELLSGYLDGELDGKNKALVEDHLRSCSGCQQALESLKRQDSLMRSREIEEPSCEFVFSLNRCVLEQIMKKPRFSLWRYLPVLVPAAVAALVLVVVFNSNQEPRYVTTDDRIILPVASTPGSYDETGLRAGTDRSAVAEKKAAAAKKEKTAEPKGAVTMSPPPAPEKSGGELAREIEDVELGPLVASESRKDIVAGKADELSTMEAGAGGQGVPAAAAQFEVPKNQVIRAIVDSTGKIIKVVTGNTIVPEEDTMLEKQLEGQQMAPPTVRGRRTQMYVDLSEPKSDAESDSLGRN